MAILVGNAIVGQSGGPTSAINATLAGVIRSVSRNREIGTLYGMKNGIEGFLEENIVSLNYLFDREEELEMLKVTPSSALGSCRKRLPPVEAGNKIYEEIFSLFKKYGIRYFFYIGGNDSMETVRNLYEYAGLVSYDLRVIGIPKTIDNDLMCTDHTPGYGSAAKFIATVIKEICTDCSVYRTKAVTVVETMGRDAGWLTCAASLPSYNGGKGADLIYLPETVFDIDGFIDTLKEKLKHQNYVVAVVSEGVRCADGKYVGETFQNGTTDVFGHKYLSGTAKSLEMIIRKEIGCKVRSVELNLPQRCSGHLLSGTDIEESFNIGQAAVDYAVKGESGKMPVFVRRIQDGKYCCDIDLAELNDVASLVKYVPRDFINEEGNNVTDKCIEYILPLIQGEVNIKYKNGIPAHFVLR